MEPVTLSERQARRAWIEIEPRERSPRDPRRLASDALAAELVRWARYVDPGMDASDAQRAMSPPACRPWWDTTGSPVANCSLRLS